MVRSKSVAWKSLTNRAENPYAAAQRFLAQNDLPPTYLDEVVKFIEQQTAGVSLPANNEYVDPFTGSGVVCSENRQLNFMQAHLDTKAPVVHSRRMVAQAVTQIHLRVRPSGTVSIKYLIAEA